MARPRVFISSTFYDLRQIRSDLEQFVRAMGYEPVLHERGAIPYGNQEKLEEYAYKEVDSCDVLVSVIGGRFGSPSDEDPYSISHKEVKRAVDTGKQVYIFVDASVHSEYETYLLNKDIEGVRYKFVDDVRVFQFVEEVHALHRNNPIAEFTQAVDITEFLREQWAGLFQRFLQQQSLLKEMRLLNDMQNTVRTLDELVTFLTEERRGSDEVIKEILLRNHPIFEQIRTLLGVGYRAFFTNLSELNDWLELGRSFEAVEEPHWDDPNFLEWYQDVDDESFRLLKMSARLFDEDGRLRSFTSEEWDPEWVTLELRARHDVNGDSDVDGKAGAAADEQSLEEQLNA